MRIRATIIAALSAILLSHPAHSQSDRLRIVISDLHFGIGRGHPTEDFLWGNEFREFLLSIGKASNERTDLIIAGDLFELWQPLNPKTCDDPNANLGCTESQAVAVIADILTAHQDDLENLAAFARRGENHLYIIPGNHDSALLFPEVRRAVLKQMGIGLDKRVTFEERGYWLSDPDRLIIVEHGQQIGKDVNRFARWPGPFLQDEQNKNHLQRTWGERFVQKFYNRFEARYAVIDNIADDGGIGYGLRAEGLSGSTFAIGKFISFYLGDSSWSQVASSLNKQGTTPKWDLDAVRAQGDIFLVESLPTDSALYAPAKEAYENGTLGFTIDELTDVELAAACDARAALSEAQEAARKAGGPGPTITRCPANAGSLSALAQALIRPNREKLVSNRASDLYDNLHRLDSTQPRFAAFVYAHTHTAYRSPDFQVMPGWKLDILNTGAWQRIATAEQFKEMTAGKTSAQALMTPLDDFPPCYPVIRFKPYKETPVGELLVWSEKDGAWGLNSTCNWKPSARAH